MSGAGRNRVCSAGIAAAFLLAGLALAPDPEARVRGQYLAVTTLGYGHLLGAALLGRRRLRLAPPGIPRPLSLAFSLATLATLFGAYAFGVGRWPELVLVALAVSVWHVAENDRMLGRAYSRRDLRLGGLPRSPAHHAGAAIAALLLVGAGAAALEPGQLGPLAAHPLPRLAPAWLGIGDVFATTTTYHLTSWIVLALDRRRRLRDAGCAAEAARLARGLLWVHALPAAACAALLASSSPGASALRAAVFSPGIYLFWSVLHVAQTALARGVERRSAPAARP